MKLGTHGRVEISSRSEGGQSLALCQTAAYQTILLGTQGPFFSQGSEESPWDTDSSIVGLSVLCQQTPGVFGNWSLGWGSVTDIVTDHFWMKTQKWCHSHPHSALGSPPISKDYRNQEKFLEHHRCHLKVTSLCNQHCFFPHFSSRWPSKCHVVCECSSLPTAGGQPATLFYCDLLRETRGKLGVGQCCTVLQCHFQMHTWKCHYSIAWCSRSFPKLCVKNQKYLGNSLSNDVMSLPVTWRSLCNVAPLKLPAVVNQEN